MLRKTLATLSHSELLEQTKTRRIIKKAVIVIDVAALSMSGGKASFAMVGTDYGTSGAQTAERAAREVFRANTIGGKPFGQKRRAVVGIDLEKAIAAGAVVELTDDDNTDEE